MKNNLTIMTRVFKNAMTFEMYFKLWSDALNHIDGLLSNNEQKTQKALSGIAEEEFIIATADSMNGIYTDNAKKDIKKRKKIISILLCSIVAILLTLIVLFVLNLRKAFAMVLVILSPLLIGVGPIIIIGIIAYNLYYSRKRKRDLKDLTPSNSTHQKNIATNNIKSYNIFIEKTKKEKEYLLSKREAIVSEQTKAKKTLEQIYSTGLIPVRYQGLVQAATIYGYLYNGICTNICGHGGVYERYEDDLYKKAIIERLDQINNKLNIVIQNQRELLSTLNSIDSTLSDIKTEIKHGNDILSDIRTTSAISAAAAQQSASYQEYIATAVWRNM